MNKHQKIRFVIALVAALSFAVVTSVLVTLTWTKASPRAVGPAAVLLVIGTIGTVQWLYIAFIQTQRPRR